VRKCMNRSWSIACKRHIRDKTTRYIGAVCYKNHAGRMYRDEYNERLHTTANVSNQPSAKTVPSVGDGVAVMTGAGDGAMVGAAAAVMGASDKVRFTEREIIEVDGRKTHQLDLVLSAPCLLDSSVQSVPHRRHPPDRSRCSSRPASRRLYRHRRKGLESGRQPPAKGRRKGTV